MVFASSSATEPKIRPRAAVVCLLISLALPLARAAFTVQSGTYSIREVDADGSIYRANIIKLQTDSAVHLRVQECAGSNVASPDRCGSATGVYCCPESHPYYCTGTGQGNVCSDGGSSTVPPPGVTPSPQLHQVSSATRKQIADLMDLGTTYFTFSCTGFTPPTLPEHFDGPRPSVLPPVPRPLDEFFTSMELNEGVRTLERRRSSLGQVDPSQTANLTADPAVEAALNAVPPGVEDNLLTLISFVSVYNPVDGSTMQMGPDEQHFEAGCTISFTDITNSAGDDLGSFSGFTKQQLTCDADAIKNTVLPDLEAALAAVEDESLYDRGFDPEWRVLKVAGSEAFSGCREFITSALQFTEVTQTETTKACGEAYNTDAWKADPCCNKQLQATQCCRATAKPITREQLTGVDTNVFAEACSPEGVVPATVAAEALVAVRKAADDAKSGCAAKMAAAKDMLDSLHTDVQDCMQDVFWQQSRATCQTDMDCTLTEQCLSVSQNSKQCAPVPADRKGEYMFKCLRLKLPDLFFRVLRKQYGISQTATDAQAADQLKARLSTDRCVGPDGWQHSGRYENGQWVPGNASACVAQERCNYDQWQITTQAACETNELGGYFCGECWSDNDCQERSAAPMCIVSEEFSQGVDQTACQALDSSYRVATVDWNQRCLTGDALPSQAQCQGSCTATDGPNPVDAMWCVKPDTTSEACDALRDPSNNVWPYFTSQVWDPTVGRWGSVWRTNVCVLQSVRDQAACANYDGFMWTVNPWDKHENKCARTMCFNSNTTQSACWQRSWNSGSKNYWWDESLNGGAGACLVRSNNANSPSGAKSACDAEGDGFKFYAGFRYRPGDVYTQTQCENEGVCDIWGVPNNECSQQHRCTGRCPQCRQSPMSPPSLCYRTDLDSSACSSLGGSLDSGLCKLSGVNSRDDCTSTSYNGTFHSCSDFSYDQCEGNEAQAGLHCQKDQWGECGDQASCEAHGQCEGAWFPTGFFDQQSNQYVELEQLCRLDFQYRADHDGYECPSLQSLGITSQSHPGWSMDYTPLGCVVAAAHTQQLCDGINGTLVPVPRTQAQCESWKMCCTEGETCTSAPWDFSPLGQAECELCGGTYQNIFTWVSGSWVTGTLKPLAWKQRSYGPVNQWKPEVDDSRFWMLLDSVREEMEMSITSDYLKCMYSGFTSFLGTIACACGINQEACGGAISSDLEFEAEPGTAYAGSESNSRTFTSRIKTNANSIDPNTNNGVNTFTNRVAPASSLQTKPKEVNGVKVDGSDGSGRRRLETEAHGLRRLTSSSDSPDCYTVVQNSNAVVVGQVVGSCVSVTPAYPLANPVELCVNVDASIPTNAAFTTKAMAVRVTSGTDKIIRVATSSEASGFNTQSSGTEYCASISGAGTYCPVLVKSTYASETTSVTASCEKLDTIVTTVVQKQIELGKAQPSASGLAAPSLMVTILAALAAALAVRRGD
mmetsp:Transcript_8427/g.26404  ORF Transcript_8427/g.26404 Transcript_8427/m.26404 type:complete len:1456 (-) Transcript_8427:220-4587(-)